MKVIDMPCPYCNFNHETRIAGVELTRRNLEVLLAKLDMPGSQCTIITPDGRLFVRAVENVEHYAERDAGGMLVDGEII